MSAPPQQQFVPLAAEPQLPPAHGVTEAYLPCQFIHGGAAAIFHLASSRVVICYDRTRKKWFLPKGRRDIGESSQTGAEREGFEESGYRNRVLPVPIPTVQTRPSYVPQKLPKPFRYFITEPICTNLVPIGSPHHPIQYIRSWYVAETLSPDVEESVRTAAEKAGAESSRGREGPPYMSPAAYPENLTLADRIGQEPKGYEPPRHENSTTQADEENYEGMLLPIQEAYDLVKGKIDAWIIHHAWKYICERHRLEANMDEQQAASNSVM